MDKLYRYMVISSIVKSWALSHCRRKGKDMTIEQGVRLLAGTMILISLALARFVSNDWLFLTLFVGLNLFQSALTGWCPAEFILKAMGMKPATGNARCCIK